MSPKIPFRRTPSHATAPAAAEKVAGVQFPVDAEGSRSTGRLAKEVVADTLSSLEPDAAERVRRTANWRKGYIEPFTEMVRAGVDDAGTWNALAATALEALQSRMVAVDPDTGAQSPMTDYLSTAEPRFEFDTETITGDGPAVEELVLPYRGTDLRGAALRSQLDRWVADGAIEPSCAEALRTVQAHPEWLSLPGRAVAVLGLGSEMGPARPLLRWGADVLGVDLPSSPIWKEMRRSVPTTAGSLRLPVRGGRPGADLLTELPELAQWLTAAAPAPREPLPRDWARPLPRRASVSASSLAMRSVMSAIFLRSGCGSTPCSVL